MDKAIAISLRPRPILARRRARFPETQPERRGREAGEVGRRPLILTLIAAMLLAPLVAVGADAPPPATSDCPRAQWDMSQEVALFKDSATSLSSGTVASGAPRVELNKLYQVTLAPADHVSLARGSRPERKQDGNAGLLAMDVPVQGTYRVSVDGPFWIDALGASGPIASTGFQGHQVCLLIHKSVEFALPPGRTVFQVSGSSAALKFLVTRRQPEANSAH